MVRKLLPVILLAPLAVAACSSRGETSQSGMSTTTTYHDQQAMQTAQQALKVAQQAQATADDAKKEADRMNQRSLQK